MPSRWQLPGTWWLLAVTTAYAGGPHPVGPAASGRERRLRHRPKGLQGTPSAFSQPGVQTEGDSGRKGTEGTAETFLTPSVLLESLVSPSFLGHQMSRWD